MLSVTATYALQATLYLARQAPAETVSAQQIARDLDVPANYLAKVLHTMANAGLLESTRGVKGGYRLAQDPRSLSVYDVVEPFNEFPKPSRCLLGGTCDLENPCTAHNRRLEWRRAQRNILRETHLAELLEEPALEEMTSGSQQL